MKEKINYPESKAKKAAIKRIAENEFDGNMAKVMRAATDLYLDSKGVETEEKTDKKNIKRGVVRGVRLNAEENEAFEKIMVFGELTSSEILLKLIRRQIAGDPYFSQAEVAALREANRQLIAVGRNLNQLMRSINSGKSGEVKFNQEDMSLLRERVLNQSESISDLIQANNERVAVL